MSSRTTTTPTGDPKQPDCLPFREMVKTPQSLFSTEFVGAPVPALAPSRAPKPRNAKRQPPSEITMGMAQWQMRVAKSMGAASGHEKPHKQVFFEKPL